MNLFYQPGIQNGDCFLDEEESRHCVKALRKKTGDVIQITDGKGHYYEGRITNDDLRRCTFSLVSQKAEEKRGYSLHLAIAPTRNEDRMEWLLEKVTEIGIDQVTFMVCEHSEKIRLRMERLTKIALSAMKQSLRATMPLLEGPVPFDAFIQRIAETEKFIAHVHTPAHPHLMAIARPCGHYVMLIGPEGDFSDNELALAKSKGFIPVGLGPNRLRTETAGLVSCTALHLLNEISADG